jgi:hypothetical protein
VQEAPNVVIGMFLINDTSAVVLFDSGASHSFISIAYVDKHNLPFALLKYQMLFSSMGGDMPARQLCLKVNIKIRGVYFIANLIVLELKGIDVILGMDWMTMHKVLIEYAKKSVKLTTPDGKEMEFVVEPVVIAKGVTNSGGLWMAHATRCAARLRPIHALMQLVHTAQRGALWHGSGLLETRSSPRPSSWIPLRAATSGPK